MSKNVSLFIIGVQKAGTTSMYNYLLQSDEFAGHITPEYTFYTHIDKFETGEEAGFNYYFSGVDVANKQIIAKCASMLFQEEALIRLKKSLPNVKLIVILREPVSRAYSSFKYAKKTGRETITNFKDAFLATNRFPNDPILQKETSYREMGFYAKNLKLLYSLFPKENIKVVKFDDLNNQTNQVVADVYGWFFPDKSVTFDIKKKYNSGGAERSTMIAKIFRPGRKLGIYKLFNSRLKTKLRKFLNQVNTKEDNSKLDQNVVNELKPIYKQDIFEVEKITGLNLENWK